jgi:hypothetical protein
MQLAAHVWLTSVVGSNIQFPTLNLCVHSQHLHLCHETPVQSPDTALNLNMQKLQLKFRVSSRGLSELLYFTPSPESPRGPRGSNLGTNSRTDEHGKKMPFNQNWVMPAFSKCFCHPKKTATATWCRLSKQASCSMSEILLNFPVEKTGFKLYSRFYDPLPQSYPQNTCPCSLYLCVFRVRSC